MLQHKFLLSGLLATTIGSTSMIFNPASAQGFGSFAPPSGGLGGSSAPGVGSGFAGGP